MRLMAERVRLAEILDEHMDDMVILGRLFELYPDQKRSRKAYRHALEELRTKEPRRCSYRLVIDWVEDDDGSRWPHACGVRRGDPERWGLQFQPWAEWLGNGRDAKDSSRLPAARHPVSRALRDDLVGVFGRGGAEERRRDDCPLSKTDVMCADPHAVAVTGIEPALSAWESERNRP
jgi:hypothetical protein